MNFSLKSFLALPPGSVRGTYLPSKAPSELREMQLPTRDTFPPSPPLNYGHSAHLPAQASQLAALGRV